MPQIQLLCVSKKMGKVSSTDLYSNIIAHQKGEFHQGLKHNYIREHFTDDKFL